MIPSPTAEMFKNIMCFAKPMFLGRRIMVLIRPAHNGPYSPICFLYFWTHANHLRMAWTSTMQGPVAIGLIFRTSGAWVRIPEACTNVVSNTCHACKAISGAWVRIPGPSLFLPTPFVLTTPLQFIDNKIPAKALYIYGFAHWWCTYQKGPRPRRTIFGHVICRRFPPPAPPDPAGAMSFE